MRIAIIGAAGMVGSQIVAEAAARGHQVHGYTRSGHGTGSITTQALQFTDTDAVAQHQLSEPLAVDEFDANVHTVGLYAGAFGEAGSGEEDASVALGTDESADEAQVDECDEAGVCG